ncbi:type VII secretion system-associated protein [Pseudonocardia alni]|uniref:type VII secretion system-associated protein n=1 Tax=Pseudonocardia alni TaxID=33907 RepID=UPI00280AF5F7|nr:type VII secretion system-associated protein [Pseudonocardia alni]
MSTAPDHTPAPEGGPAGPEVPGTAEDRIAYLVDPAWRPTPEQSHPDPARIVGAWILRADGCVEGFQTNPDYVPADPGSPTDPVDAVLQILALDRADGLRPEDETLELLDTVLLEARLGVALDETGVAVVRPAPGGGVVPVVTAAAHRDRVTGVASWRETTAAELAAALPAEGVDVVVNPDSPAPALIPAATLRSLTGGASTG